MPEREARLVQADEGTFLVAQTVTTSGEPDDIAHIAKEAPFGIVAIDVPDENGTPVFHWIDGKVSPNGETVVSRTRDIHRMGSQDTVVFTKPQQAPNK